MSLDRVSYTVTEAAEAAGVSETTIRRAYRSTGPNALPVHYPTSRPVILRADLEAWVANSPTDIEAAS